MQIRWRAFLPKATRVATAVAFFSSIKWWKPAWRAIELGGDLDFIFGVLAYWPAVSNAIAESGYLPLVAIGFALLIATFKSKRVRMLLVAGASVALLIFAFRVGQEYPSLGNILDYGRPVTAWSATESAIRVQMDLSKLERFQSEYKVGVSCRAKDKTIDFLNDKEVFRSRLFSIQQKKEIEVPAPQSFYKKLCSTDGSYECFTALAPAGSEDQPMIAIRWFTQAFGGFIPVKCGVPNQ